MRRAWMPAFLAASRSLAEAVIRGSGCPRRGRMVRIASALGLIIFSLALLILSLISYVSIKKDFLPGSARYGPNGGPRMYMFHTGFR